jgi:ribosomal protein S18 acetylase RimI-like enzyme
MSAVWTLAQYLDREPGYHLPPMTIPFVAAAELTYADLAKLFERTFAGYIVPVRVTPSALEARNRIEGVDLFASQIALHGTAPVALALIARRGRRSRIAAMGVVLEARGAGVGQALLDKVIGDAKVRGDDALVLECIASNERALRLYQRAGFVMTRRLVGWRAGALVPEVQPIVEVDPAELGRALARSDHGGLPWQLAPETLAVLTAPMRGWTIDGSAFATGSVGEHEVSIRAVFTRPERRREGHAARLVRGLAATFAPRLLAMAPIAPEGLGHELAAHLGAAPHELAQIELALPLAAGAGGPAIVPADGAAR